MSNANGVFGIKPGDVIQNTYKVEKLLGEGGMGATFKGHNMTTDHDVAIKVMIPSFAKDERAVSLFKRESSLLRTVNSDAVIRYETTLQDAEGRLFLVMEYVPGKPLAAYLKRGARLDSEGVLKLARRLAGGLDAIHKLNIVHRDIAPDNILVPEEEILKAKLIDFGLASDTAGTEKSILGDSVAGKFSYMAPEQLGLFGGKATPATDIYALGLVLMQVAGLSVPGAGKGIGAIESRREDLSLAGADISTPLKKLLESMLKADPKDRVSNLSAAISRALEAGDDDETTGPPIPGGTGSGSTGGGSEKSKLPLLIAAGVVGVALIGGGAYFLTQGDRPTGPSSVTTTEESKEIVVGDDPVDKAIELVNTGGRENLEVALGVFMKLGNDAEASSDTRIRALMEVAKMYDPETYDPNRSPFPQANKNAARRTYQKAADLGSADALNAVNRLGE
ncbi:MAG: protein kinase [Litoreibacter sp.]|nr:protein kinase [Litoreibacter sp.]